MKTLIIAELGINHGGSVEEGKRLIKAAVESGADCVKFQTYTAAKRVSRDNPAFDLLKRCELSFGAQGMLKQYADELGVEFFSTPFDTDALDFLIDDLGCKRVKIASFDLTNHTFLDQVNRKCAGRNVILSTGMATEEEVYGACRKLCDTDLTLLHCKSSYPTKESDLNFDSIRTLKLLHGNCVGYSNHCKDPLIPALSVLAGAEVIEAHFMVAETDECVDKTVSLTAVQFQEMVKQVRRFEVIMGDGILKLDECERPALPFRRNS